MDLSNTEYLVRSKNRPQGAMGPEGTHKKDAAHKGGILYLPAI